MLANFCRPGTSFRPRLTVRTATAAIAATLACGGIAVSSANMGTAHGTSGDVKILADVGWNSAKPKATP